MKKTNKEIRQQRLNTFRNSILPELRNRYVITSHGGINAPDSMYKIIMNDITYDYYPMSEKIRITKTIDGKLKHEWQEYKIEQFLKKLNII